jgi:hypothetical protein
MDDRYPPQQCEFDPHMEHHLERSGIRGNDDIAMAKKMEKEWLLGYGS